MSRIDEALRRAERESSGDAIAIAPATEHAAHVASLDRYVAERPGGGVERPGAVRTIPRGRPQVVVPAVRPVEQTRSQVDPDLAGKLVTTAETDALSVEQYRRLAAVLEEIQSQRGLKSLMV